MSKNALVNHSPEIMQVIIDEQKEPNPLKLYRPWMREDSLDTAYTTTTQEEYKAILGRLLRKEVILAMKLP